MKPRAVVVVVAALLLTLGCQSAAGPEPVVVVVAGSSTIQPLLDIAAPLFEREHPGARVEVQGGGSSVGISAVRAGLAQIGMVSRALKPDEQDLTATLIGRDGIALVVHKDNPIAGLNSADVVKIYSGELTSWRELGGRDAPITVINKEEGRSTLELFEKHFDLKGRFVKNAVIIGPNGQAIATVAGNVDAIAYVSIGSATVAAASGSAIRLLPLDGVDASVDNVRKGSYGLVRDLTLSSRGAQGEAKALLEFMTGPVGKKIVVDEGFVTLDAG